MLKEKKYWYDKLHQQTHVCQPIKYSYVLIITCKEFLSYNKMSPMMMSLQWFGLTLTEVKRAEINGHWAVDVSLEQHV